MSQINSHSSNLFLIVKLGPEKKGRKEEVGEEGEMSTEQRRDQKWRSGGQKRRKNE